MKQLVYFGILILFLSSCTERGRLERRADRIGGKWYFDRAFYKEDNALFRNNLMDDYRGDQIIFHEDGFAEYYDASLDAYFGGDWVLTLHKYNYHDGSERIYTLDMEFYDYIHRDRFSIYCDAVKIGLNNLNLESYDDFGTYTFKLNKID